MENGDFLTISYHCGYHRRHNHPRAPEQEVAKTKGDLAKLVAKCARGERKGPYSV